MKDKYSDTYIRSNSDPLQLRTRTFDKYSLSRVDLIGAHLQFQFRKFSPLLNVSDSIRSHRSINEL